MDHPVDEFTCPEYINKAGICNLAKHQVKINMYLSTALLQAMEFLHYPYKRTTSVDVRNYGTEMWFLNHKNINLCICIHLLLQLWTKKNAQKLQKKQIINVAPDELR